MCENPDTVTITLRTLFEERGLRQDFVAEKLRVSEAAISKWVNGRAHLPVSRVKPLARLLKVSSNTILTAAFHSRDTGAPQSSIDAPWTTTEPDETLNP